MLSCVHVCSVRRTSDVSRLSGARSHAGARQRVLFAAPYRASSVVVLVTLGAHGPEVVLANMAGEPAELFCESLDDLCGPAAGGGAHDEPNGLFVDNASDVDEDHPRFVVALRNRFAVYSLVRPRRIAVVASAARGPAVMTHRNTLLFSTSETAGTASELNLDTLAVTGAHQLCASSIRSLLSRNGLVLVASQKGEVVRIYRTNDFSSRFEGRVSRDFGVVSTFAIDRNGEYLAVVGRSKISIFRVFDGHEFAADARLMRLFYSGQDCVFTLDQVSEASQAYFSRDNERLIIVESAPVRRTLVFNFQPQDASAVLRPC